MANNIENIQSDSARLHKEILELIKEHSDIIKHADDYRERWQTVFPDGMLEELCVEFKCCPAMIFIALESNSREFLFILPIREKLLSFQGIYSISHRDYVYIGQTHDSFRNRWMEHISKSRRDQHKRLYQYVNEHARWENMLFRIEEILPNHIDFFEAERNHIAKQKESNKNLLNYVRPSWNKQLTDSQNDIIFELLLSGCTNNEISQRTGVSEPHISDMRKGKKHRPENIEYPILSRTVQAQLGRCLLICNLLNDPTLSLSVIAKMVQCNVDTVRRIYKGVFVSDFIDKYGTPPAFPPRNIKQIRKQRTRKTTLKARKEKVKKTCPHCGNTFLSSSNRVFCSRSCASSAHYQNEIPTHSELKGLIRIANFTAIGKLFDVSDNTIRKWCQKYNLPTSSYNIKRYTDEEWEQEIWNDKPIERVYFTDQEKLLPFLSLRCYFHTKISENEMKHMSKKYHLGLHTIDWTSTTCHLTEHDLYFRSAEDAGKWLLEHTDNQCKTHTYFSKKIAKAFKNNIPATLDLPVLSSSSTTEPSTFTFSPVPQDTFYSVIQHHHVVSYAFDPKWRDLIEDPSILPDFITLDDLPWVAEFKKFYGME